MGVHACVRVPECVFVYEVHACVLVPECVCVYEQGALQGVQQVCGLVL